MSFDYDLFVIGGGSGGVRAARLAAETGARVGLAEADRMGGTCVIRGCVPKKLMVFAAGFTEAKQDADGFGWHLPELTFDWDQFKARLHAELDRLEGLYRANLAKAGVVTHDTRATVAGPHEVRLDSGATVSAAHILIAVGGRPFKPELPGIGHALTSDDMFHLPALPKRALVVGGGYIACEFASILNGLGVEVLQYYRGAQILRGFDDEIRGHLAEAMRDRGVGLHVGTELERIEPVEGGGRRVICTDGSRNEVDLVLYATGRRPDTADLGLETVGIETGRNGEIPVDRYSQTAVPSIFAVGDVTDRVNLTPVAIREGAAFVETVFRGNPTAVDHDLIAKAVFARPEIGSIGLTEEAARDREPVEIYTAAFRPMQNILANRPERVLMKLIVAREGRRVLGVHIIGPGAAEIVQMAAVAVTMGATKEDFDRTVAVHPTMAEELVTMKQPARVA